MLCTKKKWSIVGEGEWEWDSVWGEGGGEKKSKHNVQKFAMPTNKS